MIASIKEILEKIIEGKLGIPRIAEEFKISSIWGKINSSDITANATPDKFVGGVLYLNVRNSAWAQQLNMLKPGIITKINNEMGNATVKDIRMKTGFRDIAEKTVEQMPARNCARCGVEYFGEKNLCQICSRKHKLSTYQKLCKLVEKNPRMTFQVAKGETPGIDETDYRRAKRDVNAYKSDQKYNERRQRGRKTA